MTIKQKREQQEQKKRLYIYFILVWYVSAFLTIVLLSPITTKVNPLCEPDIQELCASSYMIQKNDQVIYDSASLYRKTKHCSQIVIYPNIYLRNQLVNLMSVSSELNERVKIKSNEVLEQNKEHERQIKLFEKKQEETRRQEEESKKEYENNTKIEKNNIDKLEESENLYSQVQLKTAPTNIDYPTITFHDQIKDDALVELKYEWASLPEYLRKLYLKCGWTFELTNAAISSYVETIPNAVGLTIYSQKKIVINISSIECLEHEMGHFLGYMTNLASYRNHSDIVEEAYLAESSNSNIRDYARSNSEEFFADMYSWYLNGHVIYSCESVSMRDNVPKSFLLFQYIECNLDMLLEKSPFYMAAMNEYTIQPGTEYKMNELLGIDISQISGINFLNDGGTLEYCNIDPWTFKMNNGMLVVTVFMKDESIIYAQIMIKENAKC